MKKLAALLACMVMAAGAHAQGVGPSPHKVDLKMADEAAIAYKLTPSYYHTSSQPDAYDVNLRANLSTHTAWIGYYQRASEFSQLRLGYEDTIALPFGHLVPSFQYA